MSRTVVITDIHGMDDLFSELLNKIKLKKDDKLILLGDYVDRGSKSKEVINSILELKKDYEVICLKGNHDDWFEGFLNGELHDLDVPHWLRFGGLQTIESYCGEGLFRKYGLDDAKSMILSGYEDHLDFLEGLKLYHEDEKFYYVHAGLNPFITDIDKNRKDDFYWMKREIFLPNKHSLNKPIVFGHTPVFRIYDYIPNHINNNITNKDMLLDPFISSDGDKIGIDGGAVFGKRLYAMLIEDGEYNFEYVD